jgi:hypothetical protein
VHRRAVLSLSVDGMDGGVGCLAFGEASHGGAGVSGRAAAACLRARRNYLARWLVPLQHKLRVRCAPTKEAKRFRFGTQLVALRKPGS